MIDGSRDETLADGYMKAERMVEGIFQHAYLFNITADPYERNDLSRVGTNFFRDRLTTENPTKLGTYLPACTYTYAS